MPRRYRRYRRYPLSRPIKSVKYSNETFSFANSLTLAAGDTYHVEFVPATTVAGIRKLKNFTLSFNTSLAIPAFFAIVYVPEGTEPLSLNFGSTISTTTLTPASLYEPNQNVILSGTIGGPNFSVGRYSSRLARNLNSGDRICLVFRTTKSTGTDTGDIAMSLNYAIAF